MEAVRESWNDGRMDDLNAKVDRVDGDVRALRVEMKTEFTAVRGEMREGFEKIDKRFDRMEQRFDKVDRRFERVDERFEKVDERFESLHRLMFQFAGGMTIALIGAVAALIAQL